MDQRRAPAPPELARHAIGQDAGGGQRRDDVRCATVPVPAARRGTVMRREITNEEQLRDIVGHPAPYVANKVADRLSGVHRDWLAHSPLGFVATTDADGRIDVSPKGDPPGFVHVIDEVTIALPERPGNRRADGYLNVLQQPGVGTLFVVPGRGDTLRINGRATIVADADYFDAMAVDGKRPILALEIDVAE